MTATTTPPVGATFTESLITKDTIDNLSPGPTVTAQTILNREPSVFAYTDGPLGVRTNVFVRAFNSSQFSETYDGVGLNDVFNGGVTNQAENVNNVLLTASSFEGVELYRGINNPSVNSYNSLGGTVNYLPRQPSEKTGGDAGVSYGSFNTLQWHANVDTGDIGGLTQRLGLSSGSSDGWLRNTSDRNRDLYYAANLKHDADVLSLIFIFNRNTGYTPNNIPIPLLLQYGSTYQWPADVEHHEIADTSSELILGYKTQFSSNIVFDNKFFVSYDDYQRTSFSNPADQQSATQPYQLDDTPNGYPFWLNSPGYPSGPTYDPTAAFGSPQAGTDYHYYGYTTVAFGDTPKLTLTLPGNQITIGGNVTYGQLHSREYWYGSATMPHETGYNDAWDEHDTRILASAYGQDEMSLLADRLHLTGGVKYVYADTTDADNVGFYYPLAGTASDSESYVSPTASGNFSILDGLNVYAAYGQNIKFPDISAYYGAFQTNSAGVNVIAPVAIKPEYVNDYEAGIKYQGHGFYGAVNVYREDFENTFFTSTNSSGLSLFHNGGRSRYQGAELQLIEDLGHLAFGDLSGYVNYAYNSAKFTTSFNSDYAGTVNAGQPLAGVPDNLVNAGFVYKWGGWRFNVDGRYIGRQYVDQFLAGTPSATTIKPYYTLNLGLSKTLNVDILGDHRSIKAAVNVDNLLDRSYYNEAYSDTTYGGTSFLRAVVAAPRSVTGSLSVSF